MKGQSPPDLWLSGTAGVLWPGDRRRSGRRDAVRHAGVALDRALRHRTSRGDVGGVVGERRTYARPKPRLEFVVRPGVGFGAGWRV